jgi:hypothetical protein
MAPAVLVVMLVLLRHATAPGAAGGRTAQQRRLPQRLQLRLRLPVQGHAARPSPGKQGLSLLRQRIPERRQKVQGGRHCQRVGQAAEQQLQREKGAREGGGGGERRGGKREVGFVWEPVTQRTTRGLGVISRER